VTLRDAKRRRTVQPAGPEGKRGSAGSGAKNTWLLPSGKKLAEFALESGFLSPHLMQHGAESNAAEKKLS
jgi:hypothetical protein